ncbi:MFS transporter [Sanyastnella coralliicola]|uniref:MFS transporter n=1 Tax=Sanyastnella coralliicola TaxID=3069118 RepID=UPI0027B9D601|nr:MFS transporter [Longitalea sp. SCSIO 12813]
MRQLKFILPVIVLAQFFCTSLWFAGNGVMPGLIENFGLEGNDLGHLTSVVQFGFILGTLLFALLSVADRFSPSHVFFTCALLAGGFNLAMIWDGNDFQSIIAIRFFTGFFLAGIYPVGMKIASDYFHEGLGKSLGFLVGALVLGTAFPHLLSGISTTFEWQSVLITTSILAFIGGLMIVLFIPDGPFRKRSQQVELSAMFKVFKVPAFRSAAFGYFGHMWELYAFWAFVPIIIAAFNRVHDHAFNVSLTSFAIIAIGGIACVVGGFLSQRFGVKKVATLSLLISGICCLLCPFVFLSGSAILMIPFLLIWGMSVIADSPLFSTLVAQNAPAEWKGTALTIVNSLGFAITIVSIQLVSALLANAESSFIFMILAIGPLFGLIALRRHQHS